jgi:hypothetical protein
MSQQKRAVSGWQLFGGAVGAPVFALIFWSMNSYGCTGIFVVLTLIFWAIVAFRFSAYVRFMSSVARGSSFSPDNHTLVTPRQPRPPAQPSDDSRSIFL